MIGLGSFNEKGGLYRADIVDKNLIDVFVPFLPLEKRQINQCIRDDFLRKHVEPTRRMVGLSRVFFCHKKNYEETGEAIHVRWRLEQMVCA